MNNGLVIICAWCKRVEENGKWIKKKVPENLIQSHGICEDCNEKFSYEENESSEIIASA